MDFGRNPSGLMFEDLEPEAYTYLENSGALFGTPIERLRKMNPLAIQLYMDHGIDIANEPLEIAVCAQNNNGGLSGDIWWESNVRHLFPIGEVSGVHGVYRPGGSSLSSTQVGGFRAAQFISAKYSDDPPDLEQFLTKVRPRLHEVIGQCNKLVDESEENSRSIEEITDEIQQRMTEYGSHVRSFDGVREALEGAYRLRSGLEQRLQIRDRNELSNAFKVKELVDSHIAYLEAIREYLQNGGGSRGSYMVLDRSGFIPCANLEDDWRFKPANDKLTKKICEVWYDQDMNIHTNWEDVRPIPHEKTWFENVWRDYREGGIIK